MITIEKQLTMPDTYPLSRIGQLEELLFFDIETTGFSGEYSNLYLIGCTYYRNGCWNLIQWFADDRRSEPELLHSFFDFLKDYRILIHFNGDGFDIPYLTKRMKCLGLSYDFSAVQSFDIYKKIKPYRRLLGLDSLKQKSIEQFLGVSRQDQFSGGQLIEVYEDYLITKEAVLYDLLILHNEDDLKGMPLILPILNYPDFFEHSFRLICHDIGKDTDLFGAESPFLSLTYDSDYEIPISFLCEKTPIRCEAAKNRLTFTIDLYQGTLKHFFPNYKDYYYLIYEDTAVHKSIGEYVDKEARIKATAQTCYAKKEGCFLPQFTPHWEPSMKKERKDKLSYASLDQLSFADSDCSQTYLYQLFHYLGLRQR